MHILIIVLVALGLNLDSDKSNVTKVDSGRATIYFPGDGHSGTHKADGRRFTKEDAHIAHRYLPIHTPGFLCSLKQKICTKTVIKDRGPFGALLPCRKSKKVPKPHTWNGKTFYARKIKWEGKCHWYQVQPGFLRKGFRYRGTFDLSRTVAKAIKHKSFERVVFVYTKKVRKKTKKMVMVDTSASVTWNSIPPRWVSIQ
jgi:hypothetical protein